MKPEIRNREQVNAILEFNAAGKERFYTRPYLYGGIAIAGAFLIFALSNDGPLSMYFAAVPLFILAGGLATLSLTLCPTGELLALRRLKRYKPLTPESVENYRQLMVRIDKENILIPVRDWADRELQILPLPKKNHNKIGNAVAAVKSRKL